MKIPSHSAHPSPTETAALQQANRDLAAWQAQRAAHAALRLPSKVAAPAPAGQQPGASVPLTTNTPHASAPLAPRPFVFPLPGSANLDIFPTIVTPGSLEAKTRQVDGDVIILGRDIEALPDSTFVQNWKTWRASWEAWRDQVLDSYTLRLTATKELFGQLDQWEKNLAGWRDAYKAQGGKPNSPAPAPPPEDVSPKQFFDSIETVGTAVIVVAVVGGMLIALRETRGHG